MYHGLREGGWDKKTNDILFFIINYLYTIGKAGGKRKKKRKSCIKRGEKEKKKDDYGSARGKKKCDCVSSR